MNHLLLFYLKINQFYYLLSHLLPEVINLQLLLLIMIIIILFFNLFDAHNFLVNLEFIEIEFI